MRATSRTVTALLAGIATAGLCAPAASARDTSLPQLPQQPTLVPGAPQATRAAPAAVPPSRYAAYAPVRLFDTRSGNGPLGPRGTTTLTFDKGNLPEGATALVFNLTATGPSADTFATAWPSGSARPGVASVDVARGETRSNQVVVPLGTASAGGATKQAVSFYNNAGSTHLIADLSGVYVDDTARAGYLPVGPDRVLDTREDGGALGRGEQRTLDLSDRVPQGTSAVTLNLTAVNRSGGSYVTAWPSGTKRPDASSVNVAPGQTTPNLVTVGLGDDRKVNLYNNNGATDLAADLAGYYRADRGLAAYQPVTPVRIADTRDGSGTSGVRGAIGPGAAKTIPLGNQVTDRAVAATVNLTGVAPSAQTFLSAYGTGAQRPGTSTLNLARGQTAANLANAPVGADRSLDVYNNAGSANVTLDLSGYFVPPSG